MKKIAFILALITLVTTLSSCNIPHFNEQNEITTKEPEDTTLPGNTTLPEFIPIQPMNPTRKPTNDDIEKIRIEYTSLHFVIYLTSKVNIKNAKINLEIYNTDGAWIHSSNVVLGDLTAGKEFCAYIPFSDIGYPGNPENKNAKITLIDGTIAINN